MMANSKQSGGGRLLRNAAKSPARAAPRLNPDRVYHL
jgi:hypothetical protein